MHTLATAALFTRTFLLPLFVFTTLSSGSLAAPPAPAGETPAAAAKRAAEQAGQQALAEHFLELAQVTLRNSGLTTADWNVGAALIEAAAKLDPAEPRYPRLLAETMLQAGDSEAAIKALTDYRRLAPDDRFAQIELIDLYVHGMQSLDEQLKYLGELISRKNIPDEVKSHAAYLSSLYLRQKSDRQAIDMVEQAVRLNPSSPEALQLRHQLISSKGSPMERTAGLLAILRANPTQAAAMSELGDTLASVGLMNGALDFYAGALRVYGQMGNRGAAQIHAAAIDLASAEVIAGDFQAARNLADQVIQARPNDPDSWFLRLILEPPGDKAAHDKLVASARDALMNQFYLVGQAVATTGPTSAPTTASATTVPIEPGKVLEHLQKGEHPELEGAIVAAASDLAWLELYFAGDADAGGKWIALVEATDKESVTLTRLRGWSLMLQQKDEARGTLSEAADRDPLAALGLLRLDGRVTAVRAASQPATLQSTTGTTAPATPTVERAASRSAPARTSAPASTSLTSDSSTQPALTDPVQRLLDENRHGLVGALLWSALRDQAPPLPQRSDLGAIQAELNKMPKGWMRILEEPNRYYSLKAEPLKVAHKYGEPMFAKVTLQNLTDGDITIGTDGLIKPLVWFDAMTVGLPAVAFPGLVYDRISKQVVLKGHEATSQIVRIDQGDLLRALLGNPTGSAQITGLVMTNPTPAGVSLGPGAGGMRVRFNKVISRSGTPVASPTARQKIYDFVEGGSPEEKFRNLQLLGVYLRQITLPEAPDQIRPLGQEFFDVISRARGDEVPTVSSWASFILASYSAPDQQPQAVDLLAMDASWESRLLGLVASSALTPEARKRLAAEKAEKDPEPIVRRYAAALDEALKHPPATRPATGPTTGAGVPAGGPENNPISPPTAPTTEPDDSGTGMPPVTLPALDSNALPPTTGQ